MERILLFVSLTLGIISIGTVIFYTGYNFRVLQSLRTTAHELNAWRQNLTMTLDDRYVRKDMFDTKLNNIEEKIDNIANSMERRNKLARQ